MKFGLFYEHQLPKPYDAEDWEPDQEHKLLKSALDQIELADKLGFDYDEVGPDRWEIITGGLLWQVNSYRM